MTNSNGSHPESWAAIKAANRRALAEAGIVAHDDATLATATAPVSVAKGPKRCIAKPRRIEKPAASTDAASSVPYLVGDSALDSASTSANATAIGHGPRSASAVLDSLVRLRGSRALGAFVLVSATLAPLDGTGDALDRAWRAASSHAYAARIIPESRSDGSHVHAHGAILFESDEHAVRFVAAFRAVAGAASCELREVSTFATFARTGQLTVAWSSKGIADDLRGVFAYAHGETRRKREQNLTHDEPIHHGAFDEPRTPAPRLCSCGCKRELVGRRADCNAFEAACRTRLRDARGARRGTTATDNGTRPPKRGTSTATDPDDDLIVIVEEDEPTPTKPRATKKASARSQKRSNGTRLGP